MTIVGHRRSASCRRRTGGAQILRGGNPSRRSGNLVLAARVGIQNSRALRSGSRVVQMGRTAPHSLRLQLGVIAHAARLQTVTGCRGGVGVLVVLCWTNLGRRVTCRWRVCRGGSSVGIVVVRAGTCCLMSVWSSTGTLLLSIALSQRVYKLIGTHHRKYVVGKTCFTFRKPLTRYSHAVAHHRRDSH